jgi:hypothetical protein
MAVRSKKQITHKTSESSYRVNDNSSGMMKKQKMFRSIIDINSDAKSSKGGVTRLEIKFNSQQSIALTGTNMNPIFQTQITK